MEDDLLRLARQREEETGRALNEMFFESPDLLRRQLREYLSRQVDYGRLRRTDEKIPRLTAVKGGLTELACPGATFSSGSNLSFNLQLMKRQPGWLVKRFRFHLHLSLPRRIRMVRVHLNSDIWHDPVTVPRCHLHIDNSQAHVPFPATHPRLILKILCEHIEPDFGAV